MTTICITQRPEHLDAAAAIITAAFQTEPITTTTLDLSRPHLKLVYIHIVRQKLTTYARIRHPILVALQHDRVVGVALLHDPHIKPDLAQSLPSQLRLLPMLIALLPTVQIRFFQHFLTVTRPFADLPNPHYTLEALAVHPDYQGQGIGQRLLNAIDQRYGGDAQANGVYLFTANPNTQRLYDMNGAVIRHCTPGRRGRCRRIICSVHRPTSSRQP
mgnify:CR=1 FL=1